MVLTSEAEPHFLWRGRKRQSVEIGGGQKWFSGMLTPGRFGSTNTSNRGYVHFMQINGCLWWKRFHRTSAWQRNFFLCWSLRNVPNIAKLDTECRPFVCQPEGPLGDTDWDLPPHTVLNNWNGTKEYRTLMHHRGAKQWPAICLRAACNYAIGNLLEEDL